MSDQSTAVTSGTVSGGTPPQPTRKRRPPVND